MIFVGLDYLAQNIDSFGSIDCYGSGHRRSARAVDTVNAVDDLVQSQYELSQSFSMH